MKATSSLPLVSASASCGEYWLETVTSILGSSSRRMRTASGSQSISCPVRKPRAKDCLAGSAARRAASPAPSAPGRASPPGSATGPPSAGTGRPKVKPGAAERAPRAHQPMSGRRERQIVGEREMGPPVVLITGGLTGIGRAAAVAFAKKGAKVVVAGRRDEAGKALVKELRSFGSEAEFINADVRKEDDVRALVDKTVARFGRLDVAVNNAGTEGQVGPITDQTAESYAATFDTNVLGVILSMKHEVRSMQGQRSASMCTVSSTYGHRDAPYASIYVGAKHAVEGITKSV